MVHFRRLYVLLLEELACLLRKNLTIIESKEFKRYLTELRKPRQEYWNFIIDVLVKGKPNNKYSNFSKILTIVRNKTRGHYDAKEIAKGYKIMFIKNKKEPYISRGSSVSETRFYFADAAVQIYYYKKQKDLNFVEFDNMINILVKKLTYTLWLLIVRFINLRSTFRKPLHEKAPYIDELDFD